MARKYRSTARKRAAIVVALAGLGTTNAVLLHHVACGYPEVCTGLGVPKRCKTGDTPAHELGHTWRAQARHAAAKHKFWESSDAVTSIQNADTQFAKLAEAAQRFDSVCTRALVALDKFYAQRSSKPSAAQGRTPGTPQEGSILLAHAKTSTDP